MDVGKGAMCVGVRTLGFLLQEFGGCGLAAGGLAHCELGLWALRG